MTPNDGNPGEGMVRPYEKAIKAIPIVLFFAFIALMIFADRDQSFKCEVDDGGHVVPTKEIEGVVELGAGSVYLKADDGASDWAAGGCGRSTPGCREAYLKYEALKNQRVRVGLCGTRTSFIEAGGQRLLEDRSTRSEYRSASSYLF